MPQIINEESKDHNILPIGLGDTRSLTENYAQTSPRTLFETNLELAEPAFVWIWSERITDIFLNYFTL